MTPPDHLGDDGTPHAGDGVPALTTARLRGVLDGTYASTTPGNRLRRAALRAALVGNSIERPMHPTPPTITTGTAVLDAYLNQSFRYVLSAANAAKYRVTGGIPLAYAGAYVTTYAATKQAGSGGSTPGDATHNTYQWSIEFMTDSPRVQLRYLGTGNTGAVEVDDQRITTAPITPASGGGTVYALLDFTIGSATITASGAVFTTPTAHGLNVGDQVILGAITTTTGVSANTPYYVRTVPSTTTFSLATTPGGAALTLTGDGSTASVSPAKSRKIRMEFYSGSGGLDSVYIAPKTTMWAPADEQAVRVVTVGDSIDQGTGSTLPNGSWQKVAGKLLGWTDVRQVAFGGTGFVNAGSDNTFGSATRVADVVAHNPDLLIITASQNDDAFPATTQAAALAAFQAYRAARPTTPIVVVGADASSSGPSAGRLATDTAVHAAFTQWADSRSWWIDNCLDPAGSWESGTGTAASPTGTGNRDRFGSDASHPNDLGHAYLAARFAQAFRGSVLPLIA